MTKETQMRYLDVAPALVAALLMLGACTQTPPPAAVVSTEVPADLTAARTWPHLAHVGYAVRDAERATRQTLTQLGLKRSSVVLDLVYPVVNVKYRGETVNYTIDLKIVDTGNTQLEYIQPLDDRSPYAAALAGGEDAVVHHLAFVVPSIDERLAEARQQGLAAEVLVDGPLPGGGRFVYASGILPGVLVELIQLGGSK
jgi:catechol 2,3-dioxygenase-like lactoylglutathione lyase family enzyme